MSLTEIVCLTAMPEDGPYDDDYDEDYDEGNDEDPDKWVCAYPSHCVMQGEHMRTECHTARDCAEAFFEEDKQ